MCVSEDGFLSWFDYTAGYSELVYMERLYLESGQKIKKISVNEKEKKLFIAVSKDLEDMIINKIG